MIDTLLSKLITINANNENDNENKNEKIMLSNNLPNPHNEKNRFFIF